MDAFMWRKENLNRAVPCGSFAYKHIALLE